MAEETKKTEGEKKIVEATKKEETPKKKEDKKAEEKSKEKPKESKPELKQGEEKEFIVPLRRKFHKTPKYKRVPKAVKALKKFIARHMKMRDGDLRKIKIDKYLNEELWFRGIRNPPAKIKVKVKRDGENILVELSELSEKAKWKKKKEMITEKESKKKAEEKKKEIEETKEEEKPEEKEEEMEEKEEKEEAVKEAGLKQAEKQAREMKHEVKLKKEPKHRFRQALQK